MKNFSAVLGLGLIWLVAALLAVSLQLAGPAFARDWPGAPENLGSCPANASAYRENGGSYSCHCSIEAAGSGSVWGNIVYTDDSSICRSAVHAGAIGERGGDVIFRLLPGLSAYGAADANGVSSSSYGSWHGSFGFAHNPPSGTAFVAATSGVPACPANAQGYRGSGAKVTCLCGASATSGGSVWGTNVYTDDSAICRAARHAGAIGERGGAVRLRMLPGQSSYDGTSRNGVLTSSYGSYAGSYRFE